MRISDMNWMQVEEYLRRDDRAAVPLGSTEQHAFLSLATDSILAERVAVDAAQPLGIPVFPVVAYGITPSFLDFPGTVSLRVNTYALLLRDLLDCLAHSGFKRILLVNGHGGNAPADMVTAEWMADNPHVQVKYHEWWHAPRTWAKVQETDPVASHASWMENFPWTRLPNVSVPDTQVRLPPRSGEARMVGAAARAYFADGNFGGVYQRSDEEMLALWQVAVEETRALLVESWA
jgi:creatinine amidohydrolase